MSGSAPKFSITVWKLGFPSSPVQYPSMAREQAAQLGRAGTGTQGGRSDVSDGGVRRLATRAA